MMKKILNVLCISWCIRCCVVGDGSPSRSPHSTYMRCTRRYSAGMCVEPVSSVWTFVFQKQNCTERLGCPVDWRGNRFGNYDSCMHRCFPLVDLYLEILTRDHNASTLRNRKWDRFTDLRVEDRFDLKEEEDYEVLLTRATVEGPAPDPMDDNDDTKFQGTAQIDEQDDEDRRSDSDDDMR